jgi:hypothetical protein
MLKALPAEENQARSTKMMQMAWTMSMCSSSESIRSAGLSA